METQALDSIKAHEMMGIFHKNDIINIMGFHKGQAKILQFIHENVVQILGFFT